MAGKSLGQRLAVLKEKQASIAEQIKKIETEKSQQLRKEKQERARIIGLAMLRRVEEDKCSEEELLALIDSFVISGKERRFLGLATQASSKRESSKLAAANGQDMVQQPVRSQSSKSKESSPKAQQVIKDKKLSPKKAVDSGNSSEVKRLPETANDESLMAEFNL